MAFDSSPRALGPPDMRVGGRLQAFLPAWAAITDDAFALSGIRGGFSIELADPLPGGAIRLAPPPPPRMSPHMITGHSSGSKRTMFRGGGGGGENHRPPRAMSLPRIPCPQELGEIPYDPQSKRINVHIRPDHFRMETLRSILPLLRPGDWTASIDLKDAYHHVPIAPASRDLLGFTVAGGTYRLRLCLSASGPHRACSQDWSRAWRPSSDSGA